MPNFGRYRTLIAATGLTLAGVTGAAHPLGVVAASEGRDGDTLEGLERGEGAVVGRNPGQHGQRGKAIGKLGNDAIGGEAAVGDAGETKLNHKGEQVQRFGNRMCRERVIFYGHILEVDIHDTRRHGAS